jgi:hypothetical protein
LVAVTVRVVYLLYTTGFPGGPPFAGLAGVGEEAAETAEFKPFPNGHHQGTDGAVEVDATEVIVTVEA